MLKLEDIIQLGQLILVLLKILSGACAIYYRNTMKGMKALEYRIWSRSYFKHKGDFIALNNIRNRVRVMRTRKNTLDNLNNTRPLL